MLRETFVGTAAFLGYYLAMVAVLFSLSRWLKLPGELFRKLLHVSVAASAFVLVHMFETWYLAALAAVSVGLLSYLVITWAERFPRIMKALRERAPGEVLSSLTLIFVTMIGLITLGWGWLGAEARYMVIAPLMAWGFGDAAAALVGKRWGRRPLTHTWVDNSKTAEGTIAMLVSAAAAVLATLLIYTPWQWFISLPIALVVAPVSAITELITRDGLDTITVPFATFAWLLTITRVLMWVGVL